MKTEDILKHCQTMLFYPKKKEFKPCMFSPQQYCRYVCETNCELCPRIKFSLYILKVKVEFELFVVIIKCLNPLSIEIRERFAYHKPK
jgi:hypothetical protein